ncbi:hypothetical protein QO021_30115 (plasmid) [Pseudomonas amygdali pv. lachrymans]|uniref:hypothetical protein n=1 Tax=Pseudomonas amygdali TaxID=47877 RepID=UPI0006B97AB0|nr:hypothetical protein [Pseudomonas amygdali]RMM39509.1 hypothetical protein ALQ79_200375 [Pseudomonas amygdali pv. lachrymans]WIO61344.1 hypothetical protein QO021_30115 [Pseudomonas amygdali pv. lachrymans]
MINAYQEAISSARRSGAVQENRLHGWAAIKAEGDTALINFFYVEGGQVNAEVVWMGVDPQDSMDLVAHHLNCQAGAGLELVQMLMNVYQSSGVSGSLLSVTPCPLDSVSH